MLAATVLMFASCQKSEGYYNPARKISKIYESSEMFYTVAGQTTTYPHEKHMTEEWTWDGNKLKKIDFYHDNGELEETATFTYDGKVVTKIEWTDTSLAEFVYDGKLLKAIKIFIGGAPYSETVVTQRDGKKITEFVAYVYVDNISNSKCARANQTALRLMLPELAAQDIAQHMEVLRDAKSKADTYEVNPIRLTWDDDNVTNMVMTSNAYDTRIEQVYAYDNKTNPYRAFTYYLCGPNVMNDWGSSNNPVLDSTYMTGETYMNYGLHYTYEYDGDWPVKRIYTTEQVSPNFTLTTNQYVYYEYKD